MQDVEAIVKWKALITQARELYTKMNNESAQACDDWMDEEYVKIEGSDGTIENVVGEHASLPPK